jgi:hypothetical protein
VTVTIQAYVGGAWVVGSRTTLTTLSDGLRPMALSSAPSGVTDAGRRPVRGRLRNRASVSAPALFRIG